VADITGHVISNQDCCQYTHCCCTYKQHIHQFRGFQIWFNIHTPGGSNFKFCV